MRIKLKDIPEVAHVWAQQTQNEGRCGNIFFEGNTIYSYGYHFPIASFVDSNTVLFTTKSYSVSTSSHKSTVKSAIHSSTIYGVPNASPENYQDHKENYLNYQSEIETLVLKASRSRKYINIYINDAEALYSESLSYHAKFKLRGKTFSMPDIEVLKAKAKATLEKEKESYLKLKKKAHALAKTWLLGHNSHKGIPITRSNTFRFLDFDLLRLKDAAHVETSLNVSVLVVRNNKVRPFVKKLYKLCTKCLGSKKSYLIPPNKQLKIGDFYKLKEIDSKGNATIGCHKISYGNIKDIYTKLQAMV